MSVPIYFTTSFVALHQRRPSDLPNDFPSNGPYLSLGNTETTTSKYSLAFGRTDPGFSGDSFDYAEFSVGYSTFTRPAEFGTRGAYNTEYGPSSYAIWHIFQAPDNFLMPSSNLGGFGAIVDGALDDLRSYTQTAVGLAIPAVDVANQLNSAFGLYGIMADHMSSQMDAIDDVIDGRISLETFEARTTNSSRSFVLDLAGAAGVPTTLVNIVKNEVLRHDETTSPETDEYYVRENSASTSGFFNPDIQYVRTRIIGSPGSDSISLGSLGTEGGVALGGAGNDRMSATFDGAILSGGSGRDEYRAEGSLPVNIDLQDGIATNGISSNQIVGFEDAVGSQGADVVSGTGRANRIGGGDSADTLYGKNGNDRLTGGAGDDTIHGGKGSDTAYFSGTFTDLDHEPEGVVVTLIDGNATGEGTDHLSSIENVVGSDWSDWLYGDNGDNKLVGGAGDQDVLNGRDGNDTLIGGGGRDFLYGEGGDDKIIAGAGDDIIYGDAGADAFVFTRGAISSNPASDRDTIEDFQRKDLIDLSQIDADVSRSGNQKFHYSGTTYDGDPGSLRIRPPGDTSSWIIGGDIDGNGHSDFIILVESNHPLNADDLIL